MRTLIVWGAGRIGRGFVADIFRQSPDFRLVFVDKDARLVDALRARGAYTVAKAAREGIFRTRVEGGFTALHTSESAAIQAYFDEPELLLDIALHAPVLEEAADMLCPFIERRAINALPMDIPMNVNMARPDVRFRQLLNARLSAAGREYLARGVGISGIFAMCISPFAPDWLKAEDPLALWNNGWSEQAISADALVCPPPVLPRLRLTHDIEREETRKLYTLNMAHAFLCYLGLPAGFKTALEAVSDPAMRRALETALMEASLGLIHEFGFTDAEMNAWRETILSLLENPYIEDDLQRLGADSRRKLGAFDRLAGPARLCLKAGGAPVSLARALRAGYEYENDDAGTREVRAFVKTQGLEAALTKYSSLTPGDGLYELVLESRL